MKKHSKIFLKTTLFVVLVLCLNIGLSAQNLYVQPIGGGEQEAFAIANKPKITFSQQTMSIATTVATEKNFPLSQVQNLSFVKNQSTSIALNDVLTNQIRLYPNPVEDVLTLEVQIPTQGLRYRILDMNGRLINTNVLNSATTLIQMDNYRTGTYIISVDQNGQPIQSFKIVKK